MSEVARVRLGVTMQINVPVLTDGDEVSLVGRNISAIIVAPNRKQYMLNFTLDGEHMNKVKAVFEGMIHEVTGLHRIMIVENLGKESQTLFDMDAVNLVARSSMASALDSSLPMPVVQLSGGSLFVGGKGGEDGVGISSIQFVGHVTGGNKYKILLTSGAEYFFLANDGQDGQDGHTPYIQDKYWYINGESTGIKADYSDEEAARQSAYQAAEANRNGAYEDAENDRDEDFVASEAQRQQEFTQAEAARNTSVQAAQAAAEDAAESAQEAIQKFNAIKDAIDDLDPSQSTSDAIVAEAAQRAAKDAELEASLGQLGPEIDKARTGILLYEGEETTLSDYDGVSSQLYAAHNGTAFASNNYYNVYYFKVSRKSVISYKLGNYTLNAAAIVVADSIPANGISFVEIVKMDAKQTGTFVVDANKYVCFLEYNNMDGYLPAYIKIKPLEDVNIFDTLNEMNTRINKASSNREREAALAPTYFNGVRLVDTMTAQLWGKSTATKIGNFVPVSATSNSITLSAADAACITAIVILACKMNNDTYRNIYFSAAEANVITKLYDFGEDIDCNDIVMMQSLHDTIDGAMGIHLSPFGYRAMAHIIASKLNTKQPFSDVFVGGWTAQFCLGSLNYLDSSIRDANGTTVCEPILDEVTVGGPVNRCEMNYNKAIESTGPYYRTFYEIAQASPNGGSVTFPIQSKYPFKGFLRVNCARQMGYEGSVNIVVRDFDGNTIGTKAIAYFADSYFFDLNDKYYDGVNVSIVMQDNTSTKVMITGMTLHETYISDVQFRPINNKSVVALLGSSNTQFPHLADAESLLPGDEDNEIVVRPDETEGDGCGYFGKELARATGAVVDNWGKSGEQTPYGLDMLHKVFSTKHYTHIILSLFANDANAQRPWADTISNIRQMAEYAKGQGCVPVVVMGYASNTGNGVIRYCLMYDDLMQGFDSPFIYTSAELH